jgi:hypothetical protein
MAKQPVSGGGINSSVVKQVAQRTGSPNLTVYSPRGVSQLGASQGSMLSKQGSFTSRPSAAPLSEGQRKDFVPLGNALTNNIGPGGPGSGRTLYGQGGTQQMHGAPVQGSTPAPRDTLAEYGRDAPAATMVQKR